jgi:hypothetical protein
MLCVLDASPTRLALASTGVQAFGTVIEPEIV